MYTEDEKGNVVLTMSREDFNLLLMALGYAAGAASKEKATVPNLNRIVGLVNRLNEGNPHYRPYATGEES